MKNITSIILIALTTIVFAQCTSSETDKDKDYSRYLGYSKINWAEGHYSRSPDKEWSLNLFTGWSDNQTSYYSNIHVFDTKIYPELKGEKSNPSKFHMNNPRAQFLVPVKFFARQTKIKWDVKNKYVFIKQGELNNEPALNYRVDLNNFSFQKVD